MKEKIKKIIIAMVCINCFFVASAISLNDVREVTKDMVKECIIEGCDSSSLIETKEMLEFYLLLPQERSNVKIEEPRVQSIFEERLLSQYENSADVCESGPFCQTDYHRAVYSGDCSVSEQEFCDEGCLNGECKDEKDFIICGYEYGFDHQCGTQEDFERNCPAGGFLNKKEPGCNTFSSDFGYCYKCKEYVNCRERFGEGFICTRKGLWQSPQGCDGTGVIIENGPNCQDIITGDDYYCGSCELPECDAENDPVCGNNRQTYTNPCFAARAGQSYTKGSCL